MEWLCIIYIYSGESDLVGLGIVIWIKTFPLQIQLEAWLALGTQHRYEAPDDFHAKNVKRQWLTLGESGCHLSGPQLAVGLPNSSLIYITFTKAIGNFQKLCKFYPIWLYYMLIYINTDITASPVFLSNLGMHHNFHMNIASLNTH